MASTTGIATRRARVHHRDRPPQGVPHRSGARPQRDRHRGAASQRRSAATRSAARVRRRLHARTWAIESASGLGALLAQQLVPAGETVLDVPPTLSARGRLLDAGCTDRTDPHDARAAAIVALRHTRLRQVAPVDHTAVLRLLADRHHDLTGLRTQAICRLHALLCSLILAAPAGCCPPSEPATSCARSARRSLSSWNASASRSTCSATFAASTTSSWPSTSASSKPSWLRAPLSPTSTGSARWAPRSSWATPATSPGSRAVVTTPATSQRPYRRLQWT